MATFTSNVFRQPGKGVGGGGHPVLLRAHITISAAPADGDIYQMMKTPDQFLCWGGSFVAADIDTGTEALDVDVGWAANGTASQATCTTINGDAYTDSGYAADPDGFLNVGVLTGDAITDLHVGANYRPIILPTPLYFHKATDVQLEANVAAGTFTAGVAHLTLFGEVIDGAIT